MATISKRPIHLQPEETDRVVEILHGYAAERFEHSRRTKSAAIRENCRQQAGDARTLADNGERKTETCPECEGGWVRASFKRPPTYKHKVCPDCYTAAKVREIVPAAWMPEFGGDPRGAVLRLYAAGVSRENIDSGRERGIYVPARG